MNDDRSSSSDSSDDSDHSSLHFSSGPIMGGKSPGQLDWMNKFTKPKNLDATSGQTLKGTPERRRMTPTSSFSRKESEKPPQPEWMNKFQTTTAPQNGTKESSRERSPSPTREKIQSHVVPSTAPKTPSWMKQYQKGPAAAGAPIMPSIPSLAAVPAATKTESKASKKDWKALLSAPSKPMAPAVEKVPPIAPPTPQWMNKFSGVGKGLPMAPKMDDDDDDDDDSEDDQSVASVSSVNTTISVEPDWMSQFNKGKSGAIEPKKIRVPSKAKKADEPEWIQKFQKHNNESTVSSVNSAESSKPSTEEPEWMTRFREIGVHDVQASPVRINAKVGSQVTASSPKFNNAFLGQGVNGKGSKMSGKAGSTSLSGSFLLPPTASPDAKFGRLTMGANFLAGPSGMLSAPASPTSSGKMIFRGGISAPSSPVGGAGSALMSAVFAMTPGPPAVLRQAMDPPKVVPKAIDPAAMAPEKPVWMKKVKAVTHSRKEEPEWMVKLKLRKQGIHELGPQKGTPPWKRKDRLKAEERQRLKNETSMSNLDHSERQEGSTMTGDHSFNESRLDNHQDEDNHDNDEDQDDENIPEWMRQFKKMHLKEAEVLSYAQGRAPQGISRLRRGSIQMIERNDRYNPAMEAAKATPTVLKLPKKMSKRDIYGPKLDDATSSELDKSIGQIETARENEESVVELEKSPRVLKNVQEDQTVQTATTVRDPLPKKSSHNSSLHSIDSTATKEQGNETKAVPSSELSSMYSEQVEIDETKPENVMSMWGKTVKAKKPGNTTLMSFRMIQNQVDLVKERIARAKQRAEEAETEIVESDEESIKDVEEIHQTTKVGMDNSAAALFGFAGAASSTKRESASMDNSAAALFGFGGGTAGTAKRESTSMDNSAAALFGFANSHESSNSISVDHVAESSKSLSMDNSAADMFGFGRATDPSEKHATSNNSVSMNNSAAALFGLSKGSDGNSDQDQQQPKHGEPAWATGKSIAEEDSSDDDSATEGKKKNDFNFKSKEIANKPQAEKQRSFLDDSTSDESSAAGKKKQDPPIKTSLTTKKEKSFLDDSDSEDDSDDDHPKARTKAIIMQKSSKHDSDSDSDDSKPKKVVLAPAKKSFLEDSNSEDSSDDEIPKTLPKVQAPIKKASFDDSDSDDNRKDEKGKSPVTPSSIPVKKTFLDDSGSDSDDEKLEILAKSPAPPPDKKASLNDSDSEDSTEAGRSKTQAKPPVPVLAKKSLLDESDSVDSEDKKIKKNANVIKPSLADSEDESSVDGNKGKKVTSQAVASKKAFLEDSDSEDDGDGERPKLTPIRLSTPAFAKIASPQKTSSHDDSSSDSDHSRKILKPKVEKAPSPVEAMFSVDLKFEQDANTIGEPSPKLDPFDEEKKADTSDGDKAGENEAADALWQAALMELAAEEKAKVEKAKQDAWEAALEELAANEIEKKDEKDAWDAAFKDLEAEEKREEKKEKFTDKSTKSKGKIVDKKKTKDSDKVIEKETKKKSKDPDADTGTKKKAKKVDKGSDGPVGKELKAKKEVLKVKEKKDRASSKSPKTKKSSLVVKEPKKKGKDVASFESSPFGASPFGSSSFDDPSPFAPLAKTDDPSPFASLGTSDSSPFAPLGQSNSSPFAPISKKDDPSPFAPLVSSTGSSPFAPLSNDSPFGPVSGGDRTSPFTPSSSLDKASPFAPLGTIDKASPFAPSSEKDKKKKTKKGLIVKNAAGTKQPKSSMKLVVQTTKAKGDLHKKRTKKKEAMDDCGFGGNDDDSFGDMGDFDDNFSTKDDFGDFAEDRSVVPLRAIRNGVSKAKTGTFAPKPPLHGNKKVKPNLLIIKKVNKVKESKDTKSKDKEKDKPRSRSKSISKSSSRSRSKSADKGKSRSRSKSARGKKTRSPSASKDKKKEIRGRSRSVGKGKPSKEKGKD